jgi:gliding motility-associated-like protein
MQVFVLIRWRSILILLLSCLGGNLLAQQACYTFQTDSVGCAPLRIRVLNCGDPNIAVAYNFNLLADPTRYFQASVANRGDTSTIYTDVGTYVLAQAISGQFQNPYSRKVRVAAAGTLPTFTASTCPGQVRLRFQDSVFTNLDVSVAGITRRVQLRRRDTTLIFLVAGASPFRLVPIRVKGLQPSNCGLAEIFDTVRVYEQLPNPVLSTLTSTATRSNGYTPIRYRLKYSAPKDVDYIFSVASNDSAFTPLLTQARSGSDTSAIAIDRPLSPFLRLQLRLGAECGANARIDTGIAYNPLPASKAGAVRFFATSQGRDSIIIQYRQAYIPSPSDTLFSDTTAAPCGAERCYTIRTRTRRSHLIAVSYTYCSTIETGSAAPLYASNSIFVPSVSNFNEGNYQIQFDTLRSLISNIEALPFATVLAQSPVRLVYPDAGCRLIRYRDGCNNASESDSLVCPLSLSGSISAKSRVLQVQPLTGLDPGSNSSYFIEARDQTGTLLQRVALTGSSYRDFSRFPAQIIVYRAIQKIAGRVDSSISNTVRLELNAQISFPDIFTPNGDGVNEVLSPQLTFLSDLVTTIYNTFGQAVYRNNCLDCGWDGLYMGSEAPPGPYVLVSIGRDQLGKSVSIRKTIILAR